MQHKLNQAGLIEFTDAYIRRYFAFSKFKWLKYWYTSSNGAHKNAKTFFM